MGFKCFIKKKKVLSKEFKKAAQVKVNKKAQDAAA